MATARRLRQSILKDAIRENVDVIERRLPRGLRRSDRWRRLLFRASVFVVVPLALFLSINALTTGACERHQPSERPRALALPPRGALRRDRPGARWRGSGCDGLRRGGKRRDAR